MLTSFFLVVSGRYSASRHIIHQLHHSYKRFWDFQQGTTMLLSHITQKRKLGYDNMLVNSYRLLEELKLRVKLKVLSYHYKTSATCILKSSIYLARGWCKYQIIQFLNIFKKEFSCLKMIITLHGLTRMRAHTHIYMSASARTHIYCCCLSLKN